MSVRKKFDRKRLEEILESYGGSLRTFEELRSDSYEQAVAAESLEQLDLLYSEILTPGLNLRNLMQTCPPWPPGSPRAGQQPEEKVLREIFERFQMDRRTERVFGLVAEWRHTMALFRKAVKTVAPEARTESLDAVITVIGENLLKAKLDGIPAPDQLPSVDRVIAREKLAQSADMVKLKERKLKLEERKQKALEKRIKQAGKEEGKAGGMTKEAWEELERDLRLI
jgi:hypothetical protein